MTTYATKLNANGQRHRLTVDDKEKTYRRDNAARMVPDVIVTKSTLRHMEDSLKARGYKEVGQ